MASQSFLQLAELTEAAGGNAGQWFERAYTENPADAKIALAYGKSLLTRGEAGAASLYSSRWCMPETHRSNSAICTRRRCCWPTAALRVNR